MRNRGRSQLGGVAATPALDEWRKELARGERTASTFDDLWKAACAEMNAIEAEADGLPDIAASYRAKAANILRRAARAQEAAAS